MGTSSLKFQGLFALGYDRTLKSARQVRSELRSTGIKPGRIEHLEQVPLVLAERAKALSDVFILQIPDNQDDLFLKHFGRSASNGYDVIHLREDRGWRFDTQVAYYRAQKRRFHKLHPSPAC